MSLDRSYCSADEILNLCVTCQRNDKHRLEAVNNSLRSGVSMIKARPEKVGGDELYAICCKEPTHEVENATMVYVRSESFDTVDQMVEQLDLMMIAQKTEKKTRRQSD